MYVSFLHKSLSLKRIWKAESIQEYRCKGFSFVVDDDWTRPVPRNLEREKSRKLPPSLHVIFYAWNPRQFSPPCVGARVMRFAYHSRTLYTRRPFVPLAFRIVRDNGIPFRSTDFSIDFAMLDIVHHSYRVIRLKELKISRMF